MLMAEGTMYGKGVMKKKGRASKGGEARQELKKGELMVGKVG